MKKPTLRYQEAPVLNVEYSCGGWHCHSSLEFEDGYLCPECGTHFSTPEEPGTPYTEWSGESVEGLPLYDEWGQIVDQEEPEASLSPEDLPAVAEFINMRPQFLDLMEDSAKDYRIDYWTGRGHALARKELAESLGWTVPNNRGESTKKKEEKK